MSARRPFPLGAQGAPGSPVVDTTVVNHTTVTNHKHTIYLLPGMGGDSTALADFRRSCGERIAFVILDYPEWRALLPGKGNVDAMVEAYADMIMRDAPPGPVLLAGYSLGASVAYGIAHLLEERGTRVGLVALLDGEARPFSKDVFRKRPRVGTARRIYWLTTKLIATMRRREALDMLTMVTVAALLRPENHPKLRLLAGLPTSRRAMFLRRRLRRYLEEATQIQLVEPWADGLAPARPLQAPTVLFRSNEHPVEMGEDLGWRRLCADFEIMDIPGTHHSMLADAHIVLLDRLDALRDESATLRERDEDACYAVIAPSTGSATPET